MTPIPPRFFVLALPAALAGCGVDEITINEPLPTPTPVSTTPAHVPAIPRLEAGPHLGMITGFDPLDTSQAAEATRRYAEARDSGASIGRVQIDWADLETSRGVYDAGALEEAFADPGLVGMNVYVLISTLDSDGLTVPAYLGDADGLRGGLTFASPEVTGAFRDFLDWLAPELLGRNVWALSIGNEIDVPIGDGQAGEAAAQEFYETAFAHWNANYPDIATSITFTFGAEERVPQFFVAMRDASDLVTFNYYCLDANITVTGQAQWEADVARMKTAAGTREIFIQELGCPVGYGPQGSAGEIGGSLDNQVRFFEYFGGVFASDPQMRAATMFQLYDWSPQLAAQFAEPIRDEGFPLLADRFEEWLVTVGLLRWSDSSERPAWQTWLNQLARVRAARDD
ncbi:MAG: hypothetical protein ACX930_11795 [Erythrobacter sp.]